MHFYERAFPQEVIYIYMYNNKLSTNKKQKHPFLHIGVSCLEKGNAKTNTTFNEGSENTWAQEKVT